jgi:hypothetical protein
MLVSTLTYITLALAAVVALTLMILRIGALMTDCPGKGPAARTAAITIATGFASIGTGGVLLIGSVLPLFERDAVFAVPVALGLAALCLGLGFTQAIATLRDVLAPKPPAPAAKPAPAPAAETAQPVW